MAKLLLDEKPLVILPDLAAAIGLNEAVILQQIHYWLLKKLHCKDGKFWVYNSYQEWKEQFPFFTSRQIQYAIKNLESKKILITGNYNKLGIDRTKWYSIDYNVLSEFCPFDNFVQSLNNFVQPSDNIVQPIDTIVPPLPETTTENTSETTTDIYTPLFDFWNNQKIVTHRKLNDDLRRKIKKALSEYSLEEIKTAITTYSEIVKSPKYFFDYKWSLGEFLQRGIEKFINPEIAKQNFINKLGEKNNGSTKAYDYQQPREQKHQVIGSG